MALPPILANLPVFKLFRSGQSETVQQQHGAAGKSSAPQDVVQISDAARQRLEGLEDLASDSAAGKTATNTRTILADDPRLTLGLPPDFAA